MNAGLGGQPAASAAAKTSKAGGLDAAPPRRKKTPHPEAYAASGTAEGGLIGYRLAAESNSRQENVDEGDPVEDDALPWSTTGIYREPLRKKRKQTMDALTVVPYPARVIGSVRDQSSTPFSCNCSFSRCLKLYCDCFGFGVYCGDNCLCRDCGNNPAKESCAMRELAIQEAFALSINPFRRDVQPKCNRDDCACYLSGIFCEKRLCRCRKCHHMPVEQKKFGVRKGLVQRDVPTSIAASGALPLNVGNQFFKALAFTRATPNPSELKPPPGAATQDATSPSRRIYHELMLSPSRVAAPPSSAPAEKRIGDTELKMKWETDMNHMREVFGTVRETMTRRNEGEEPVALDPADIKQKQAMSILSTVEEELGSVARAADVARLDVITLLIEEREDLRWRRKRNDERPTDGKVDKVLGCREVLEEDQSSAPITSDSKDYQESVVRVAQEAAILWEAARLIRRKARELCQRRSAVSMNNMPKAFDVLSRYSSAGITDEHNSRDGTRKS